MGYLLAATDNDAYNALVCSSFVHHFGRDRVYQLPIHTKTENQDKEVRSSTLGRIAFGEQCRFETLMDRHYLGWEFQKSRLTKEFSFEDFQSKADGRTDTLIAVYKNGKIALGAEHFPKQPGPEDILICFAKPEEPATPPNDKA